MTTTLKKKTAPKSCRQCPRWQDKKVKVTESLENAISAIEKRFGAEDYKPTVGDYLKLLQLEKDFAQDEVKEIKVTWVESTPEPSEPSK